MGRPVLAWWLPVTMVWLGRGRSGGELTSPWLDPVLPIAEPASATTGEHVGDLLLGMVCKLAPWPWAKRARVSSVVSLCPECEISSGMSPGSASGLDTSRGGLSPPCGVGGRIIWPVGMARVSFSCSTSSEERWSLRMP